MATIKPAAWLKEHQRNVYSQAGEDGIVQKILELLPQNDGWCVEFGAWDGVELSNTRNLIRNRGYSAVLIEGSVERFRALQRNCASDPNTIAINTFIGFEKDNDLDRVLASTPIPPDFDFLSIDIDGNDYHIWRGMSAYRPKAVCIEFNPTIPPQLRFVQPADPRVNQGASLLSLVELGKEKGYELVSASRFNAFFVRAEDFPLFEIEDNRPEALWTDLESITYLFSGYDGRVFLQGSRKFPWHKIAFRETRVQHLSRFLQSYPGNYTILQMIGFAIYLLLHEPRMFVKESGERLRLLRRRWARRFKGRSS
ncbi:FkbM family methyltransferase [Aquisphaera insulae]|uniref:FkbM family methyltransferase n=1 Tax=Aquisphaera insulae TaxID=2712864 RepID=UPI0013ECB2D4|nr:FkbM family methyltransferase [Aquisphaera insulae]